VEGKLVDLAGPQSFVLKPMFVGGLVAPNQESRQSFQLDAAELYRSVTGTVRTADELQARMAHVKKALAETPEDTEELGRELRALEARLRLLRQSLDGDVTRSSRYEPVPLSISERTGFIITGSWDSQSAIPPGYADSLQVAQAEFVVVLAGLKSLAAELAALEASVEAIKAPWTPGRIPQYQ
jgi:chromosome segregation ATPase